MSGRFSNGTAPSPFECQAWPDTVSRWGSVATSTVRAGCACRNHSRCSLERGASRAGAACGSRSTHHTRTGHRRLDRAAHPLQMSLQGRNLPAGRGHLHEHPRRHRPHPLRAVPQQHIVDADEGALLRLPIRCAGRARLGPAIDAAALRHPDPQLPALLAATLLLRPSSRTTPENAAPNAATTKALSYPNRLISTPNTGGVTV